MKTRIVLLAILFVSLHVKASDKISAIQPKEYQKGTENEKVYKNEVYSEMIAGDGLITINLTQ